MADSMWGWCPIAGAGESHLHARKAIGHHKTEDGYFVVWVCEKCERTWWIADHGNVAQKVAS